MMSRPYLAILLCPWLLTACVAPPATTTLPSPTAPVSIAPAAANNPSTGLVQSLLNDECRAQLNKRQEWQAVAIAMGKPTQQLWEQKVCGCVSEEAARNLASGDLFAAVNPATRNQALAKIATQGVNACLQKLFSQ